MFNISTNNDVKFVATIFTDITIVIASLTVLLDLAILFRLIYSGLLHSMNTYIHIIGETFVYLLMSSRTLYGDLYISNKEETSPSWHCRLLNYLMSMFAAGIYGSCFLQALFRFWRIRKPHERLYRTFSFHLQLILFHWMFIIILSIPVWFRAVYLSSENFCLNRFNDTWSSVYISLTSVAIPIIGITIVYINIVMYIKHGWQSRKRWKRMQRDISMIKRVLLLVMVLTNSSGAAILLWLLMFIQNHLHPLSYRLLCFIIEIGMLLCSITLLIVSPQLKRALRSTSVYIPKHHSNYNLNLSLPNTCSEQIIQLGHELDTQT